MTKQRVTYENIESDEEAKKQTTQTKIYVDVSYRDKDRAKTLDAKWDKDKKKWYILNDYETFMTNFTGYNSKERKIIALNKEIKKLENMINYNNNQDDVRHIDKAFQHKLSTEIDEIKTQIKELNI